MGERMRRLIAMVICLVLITCCLSYGNSEKADVIFLNGNVHTFNLDFPSAQAVGIKDNKIIYVGDTQGTINIRDHETKIFDLEGSTVLPGLVDAHAHVMGLGKALSQVDLMGTSSKDEILDIILNAATKAKDGEWISGRGWDQNDWEIKEFPTLEDLAGTESHPVYMRRVDGHAAWVNSKTLEICKINSNTPDPEGGKIVKDSDGNPTGILIDNAIYLVSDNIPEASIEVKRSWYYKAFKECNRFGLTGVHDAGIDSSGIELYQQLELEGMLTLRIYAMIDGDKRDWAIRQMKRGAVGEKEALFRVESVKLYADGALGSRGAAMIDDYSDDPGNRGIVVEDVESIEEMSKIALETGYQVCTHAIGDLGNRNTVEGYLNAIKGFSNDNHRFRIEHAQIVESRDVTRMIRWGIIPSIQPTHCTSDMYWAEDRVGSRRIVDAYKWKTFLLSGAKVAFGSDFPVEYPDPRKGIYAAITRMDESGWPDGGWYPQERVSPHEALEGFTINAAYARFAEDISGSIEIGKIADLTIFRQDPIRLGREAPKDILSAEVLYTVVDGVVVYSLETND
jgi:predicted amidohydrolase YtcJ